MRGSEQERSLLQGQGEIRSLKERVAELSSEVSNMRRHNSSLEADNKKFEEQLLRHKNVTMDSQDKHTQALQVNIYLLLLLLFICVLRSYNGPVVRHRR